MQSILITYAPVLIVLISMLRHFWSGLGSTSRNTPLRLDISVQTQYYNTHRGISISIR